LGVALDGRILARAADLDRQYSAWTVAADAECPLPGNID
jgi:hypothetical protein